MLAHHLKNTQSDGFILKSSAHTFLVDPELCCYNCLSLWDLRQIELELLMMSSVRRQLPVILHCPKRHMGTQDLKNSNFQTEEHGIHFGYNICTHSMNADDIC